MVVLGFILLGVIAYSFWRGLTPPRASDALDGLVQVIYAIVAFLVTVVGLTIVVLAILFKVIF